MQILFQYFGGCPNWQTTHTRLLDAVAGSDDVTVEMCPVETPGDAERVGFFGSPSMVVDGVDLFGDAGVGPIGCLSCRVYAGADGSPTQQQIRAAIAAVRDC